MPVLLVHARADAAVRPLSRLRASGIDVIGAVGAAEANACLVRDSYELVLLDTALPSDEAGRVLDVLKHVGPGLTMIWCSLAVLSEPPAGSPGQEADPCVALVARMRRLLGTSPDGHRLSVGELEIDYRRNVVRREGLAVELTPTEFAVLSYLAEHPGRTVSRGELLSAIWDIRFDTGTNVVDVCIRRLRAKIDEPFVHAMVQTVRGVGYALVADDLDQLAEQDGEAS